MTRMFERTRVEEKIVDGKSSMITIASTVLEDGPVSLEVGHLDGDGNPRSPGKIAAWLAGDGAQLLAEHRERAEEINGIAIVEIASALRLDDRSDEVSLVASPTDILLAEDKP